MSKLDNYFEHLNNHISGGRFSTRSYEAEHPDIKHKTAEGFCNVKKLHNSFLIIEVNLERVMLKEAVIFINFVNALISNDSKNLIIKLFLWILFFSSLGKYSKFIEKRFL